MATKARKPEYVTERYAVALTADSRIDREKGVVYGVRIVNVVSENRRKYPSAVLARDAKKYDGRVVNVGHRKRPDDYDDPTPKFGVLREVRPAGDRTGLDADCHFNPKHPFAEPFLWACEHNPGLYAFSPHHLVRWAAQLDADGCRVAESIEDVASVDIVSVGGTTKSVFEALGDSTMTPAEVAATVTDAAGLETWLKEFIGAVTTVDAAGKTAALEAALSTLQEPEPTDPVAAMESLKRRGGVGRWAAGKLDGYFTKEAHDAARTKALQLCKEGGLKDEQITDVFLEVVTEARTDDQAKARIAERKQLLAGTPKPPSPPRTTTPGTGAKKSVDDIVAEMDA
jgi:hypothetical protein